MSHTRKRLSGDFGERGGDASYPSFQEQKSGRPDRSRARTWAGDEVAHNQYTEDEEWRSLLPYTWSCPENNVAGIIADGEEGLKLICLQYASPTPTVTRTSSTLKQPAKRTALVVANKPIPMGELIQISNRRRARASNLKNDGSNFFGREPSSPSASRHDSPLNENTIYPAIKSLQSEHSLAISGHGFRRDDFSSNMTPSGTRIRRYPVLRADTDVEAVSKLQLSNEMDVYYFEVTINSGMVSVGLVPSDSVVTLEQTQLIQSSRTAFTPHQFPVLLDQIPGMTENSVGLGANGRLLVSGAFVQRDGKHVRGDDAMKIPYTRPFKDNETIGCAWEIGGIGRVFYTRNGEPIYPGRHIKGLDIKNCLMFPAVGMKTDGSALVGNFGASPNLPFMWKGCETIRVISFSDPDGIGAERNGAERSQNHMEAFKRVNKKLDLHSTPPRLIEKDNVSRDGTYLSHRSVSNVESSTNSQTTKSCKRPSKRRSRAPYKVTQDDETSVSSSPGSYAVQGESADVERKLLSEDQPQRKIKPLSPDEVEEVRENERELRKYYAHKNPEVISFLISHCKLKQEQLQATIQAMNDDSPPDYLQMLIDLTELLHDTIAVAEKENKNRPPEPPNSDDPERPKSSVQDVKTLEQKKDVFSLICLLRGQSKKPCEAARALMSLAKDEKGLAADGRTRIRDEIASSGGMHSLLTLFKRRSRSDELKVITALAVAYLVPSIVDPATLSSGSMGLRVIECLRFLVNKRGQSSVWGIPGCELCEAAGLALTHLWLNSLQPILSTLDYNDHRSRTGVDITTFQKKKHASTVNRFRHVQLNARGKRLEQRQDMLEIQELLEMTVSLIVTVADCEVKRETESGKDGRKRGKSLRYTPAVTIESICAVELARPVAVREGLLKVLVKWLNSGDVELVRPAANALRDLTSPHDEYMAGWIHSQIVNENALPSIVKLAEHRHGDVRLAVAQILSSLSVAPHTRAAIIDANGLNLLVQLFVNTNVVDRKWDEPLALAAGSALLQLAAGAMMRASVRRGTSFEMNGAVASDKRDSVIDRIVEDGAIQPFLQMARSKRGKLRLMSVEALRVISEDVRPGFQTRQKLCDAGAAEAFGGVLREDIHTLYEMLERMNGPRQISKEGEGIVNTDKMTEDALLELHHALHALGNILEPTYEEEEKSFTNMRRRSNDSAALVKVCIETAESGGIESLLFMAKLPVATSRLPLLDKRSNVDPNGLLVESCRSLASLCPLLLSQLAASEGFAQWAGDVLLALTGMLKRKANDNESEEEDMINELQFYALRGLCALAEYEPLKIRIIDESLPELLQLKNARADLTELAQAASQACLALGITEDEIDVQLAGNDPKLLAVWFCLERSMLIQAMARDEVRHVLFCTWMDAIRCHRDWIMKRKPTPSSYGASSGAHINTLMESENASEFQDSSTAADINQEADGTSLLRMFFDNLADDDETLDFRKSVMEQYANIYEKPTSKPINASSRRSFSDSSFQNMSVTIQSGTPVHNRALSFGRMLSRSPDKKPASTKSPAIISERKERHPLALSDGDSENGGSGLLAIHPYPLNGIQTEKEWILGHRRAVKKNFDENNQAKEFSVFLPERVKTLMDFYFPSKLLQGQILPLEDLQPDSSFNFRALAMPERRYFSFRREGQVLSRVCEKHAAVLESDDVHWTLIFTNSSFAGEFAETLVQALYRCPIIQGMSFSRNAKLKRSLSLSSEDGEDDGSTLLANLAGSLPPWVTCLTFDNMLSRTAIDAFVKILETMGQLSASHGGTTSRSEQTAPPDLVTIAGKALGSNIGHAQGTFHALAIRNSPHLGGDSLRAFFRLVGYGSSSAQASLMRPPLLNLRVLDLSGNKMGDEASAAILEIVHRENSGCSLERLDLSNNDIRKGHNVVKVLQKYVEKRRHQQMPGLKVASKPWCSPLHTLNLASNSLCDGQTAIEIFEMLKNNALALKFLDLSRNGLTSDADDSLRVLTHSLESNTKLIALNLSENRFRSSFINGLLRAVARPEGECGLAFLRLEGNTPPLTESQKDDLSAFLKTARRERLKRYFREMENREQKEFADVSEGKGEEDDTDTPRISSVLSSTARLDSRRQTEQEGVNEAYEVSLYPKDSERIDNENGSVNSSIQGPLRRQRSYIHHTVNFVEPEDLRQKFEGRELDKRDSTSSREEIKASAQSNMITVLFSAPLVWRDNMEKYQPIEMLDFELERELIWQCFKEASMDIELSFDNATTHRLQATKTRSCGCLHFSGHGHPKFLTFEDGKGGLHCLGVDELKSLISNGGSGGGAPFKFVFVSACHSRLAGETFVNAGVPHVVCCKQEFQLMDSAALAFTRAFYLALAMGRTVKDSFEIGRQAVAVAPSVPNPAEEMKKFVLLPPDGDHDVPVFDAQPVPEWPKRSGGSSNVAVSAGTSRRSLYKRSKSALLGSSKEFFDSSGNSMVPEQSLPTPPQGFLGRETDMYHVLNGILSRRFVNVVGPSGIGRSSLTSAICHYINERKTSITEIDSIFYVRARQAKGKDRKGSVIMPLLKQLVSAGRVKPTRGSIELVEVFPTIVKALNKLRALIVFDRVELIEGSDEAQEFPVFLSTLFLDTRFARVLMTSRKPLGLSSLGGVGERTYNLGPLNFKDTVRLFAYLCPHVHTGEERRRLLERLVTDPEQARLCVTDETATERTKSILNLLGAGIPSRTFDVAYKTTKEEYRNLMDFGDE